MFFANDSKGKRTYIEDSENNEQYFCPVCGQEVIQRKGSTNAFHYAHKVDELCDSWSYDMSDWHRDWQNLFPEENREVVVEHNGVKHIADIKIGNTIIEFQHSRMSNDEFWERNEFYTDAGFDLVWLFDLIDEFKSERIIRNIGKEWHYKWNYHWHTFDDFVPRENKSIKVFFQICDDLSEGSCGIEHLVWRSSNGKHFVTGNGEAYDQDEFIAFFITKNTIETKCSIDTKLQFTIADVQDTLIEVNGVYFPCFAKQCGGECFENCDCCKYSVRCIVKESIGKEFRDLYYDRPEKVHARYTSGCLFRFQDILEGWNNDRDRVISVVYDSEGKVLDLTVIKNGKQITKKYDRVQQQGKSLLELLRASNSKVIGAVNLKTGYRVKVGNSGYFKNRNINKIEGYLGQSNGDGYYSDRREIFGWNKPEWSLEWVK